jgi:EmrB/QacA subfamily drug resistance transporter
MPTPLRTVASPAVPAGPAMSASAYLWWAMTSIVLGGYISVLNSHVINMVIPKMMSDLGTDVVTIRWIVTAYMMANAVVIPLVGWLARVVGARDLYICGLLLFIGSTIICGMATGVAVLIVFRIIQGVGGGLILPVTMLLMLDLYPPEKRSLGTSIWGMGSSCGSLTGIPLGGLLAEHLSWRAAFYITVLPGAVALLIAYFIMRKSPRERGVPFDWGGFFSLGTAMVALLMALSNGQRLGWHSSSIVLLFGLFGIALAAFIVIDTHVKTPMIDLGAFRSPQYVMAIVLCLIAGAMFSGGPFLLSLFLQQMYDFSVQDAAMIMFPSSAFLVLCTPIAGWAGDRIDPRYLMISGYLCYCAFGLFMMFADLRLSAFALLVIYFGRGIGLGLSYSLVYPIGISGFDFPRGKAATTILNLCVTLGGALWVAMLAAIVDQRYQVRLALLAETQQLAAVGTQHALQALEALATQLGGALSPAVHARILLERIINREALLLAFNDAFGCFSVISLCGLALALFFRSARPTSRR